MQLTTPMIVNNSAYLDEDVSELPPTFNIDKCWARLKSDSSKQCKCNKKNGNFCKTHYKSYLKNDITTIFEKPKFIKKRVRMRLKKKKAPIERFSREKYLENLSKTICIQRFARGYLVRNNIFLRGIPLYNRSLCNNKTDCLSLQNIESIPNKDFYSYKDEKGFYWGFNIVTIKECLNNNLDNPYSTLPFGEKVKRDVELIEKNLQKIIKLDKPIIDDTSLQIQQKCINIFQEMDKLKNYTKCKWLLELNIEKLKKLYKEMEDLWNYRLNLSSQEKKQYVHDGKLFTIDIYKTKKMKNRNKLCNIILDEFQKLVMEGKSISDKSTACQWILSGLTLVHKDARETLPWLYQSAFYS